MEEVDTRFLQNENISKKIENKVECAICKKSFKFVTNSHLKKHNISPGEYKLNFPNATFSSESTIKKHIAWGSGRKLSEKTKRKISIKHKGKKLSEGHKKKISIIQKGKRLSEEHKEKIKRYQQIYGNPKKGKKLSEESKKRIGIAGIGRVPWNKGIKVPEEVKNKISKKLKGKKLPIETCLKMSLSRKGRKLSANARMKISIAKKGIKKSPEHILHFLESIKKSPNKFEKKCIEIFREQNLPLKFVGDFNEKEFFIAGRVPDFVATNGKKVLVEVFYDYFKIKEYGSVDKYKRKRTEVFSKYGWKTLFFEYKEITSELNACLKTLKEELNGIKR